MKNKLIDHRRFILLMILTLITIWPLAISGYFSHQDDLQVMRIFEMRQCFADFQIPCRWVSHMGFGNGFPLFNYYGVFAYYLGGIASLALGYIGAAKLLFFIPLVIGPIGVYFLIRELFSKNAALISSVLYLFAPYRALDAYVRGAIAESFAMAIIPFVFYFSLKVINYGKRSDVVKLSLFTAAFLTSHNIMTMLFMPILLLWLIFWLIDTRFNYWRKCFGGLILAAGLASFFVLPAFFEKNLVQTDTLTRFELDFRAHFVKVSQLFFDNNWQYAASSPQSDTTMSFQVGWPLWWMVVFAIILVGKLVIKNHKKSAKKIILVLLLASVFGFSVLMAHNKSAFIWERVGILAFTQFPWRFLSVAIFIASILGGFVAFELKGKFLRVFLILSILVSVVLNWRFFKPEHFYMNVDDSVKLSGESFLIQQKGAILDYLPITATEPREKAPKTPIVVDGEVLIGDFSNKSNVWKFKADVTIPSDIVVPVFDFPNWVVYVDGIKTVHSNKNLLGRIEFKLPVGKHLVIGKFEDTGIRRVANIISLISLGVILVYAFNKTNKYS